MFFKRFNRLLGTSSGQKSLFNFLNLTFVFWSTTFMLCQTYVFCLTLSDARSNSNRQLRAYVMPLPERTLKLTTDKNLLAAIVGKNFGQTPAYDETQTGCLVIMPYPYPADTEWTCLDGPMASKELLAPTGQSLLVSHLHARLTDEDIIGVRAGTLAIYFYGQFKYRDTFGQRWVTTFRYIANGNVFDGQEHPLITAPEGNSEHKETATDAPVDN